MGRYADDLDRLATQAYEEHVIRELPEGMRCDGRWVIQRMGKVRGQPKRGTWDHPYWTEIVCLQGGMIYVGGDINPVVFAYGPRSFEGRVRWMGSRKSGADSYLLEKAVIGTGRETVYTYSPQQAAEDIQWLIRDQKAERETERQVLGEGEAEDKQLRRRVELLELALEEVDDRHGMMETLMESPDDSGLYDVVIESDIGEVPAARVFYAWAALRRLCHLLDQQKETT